MRRICRGGSRNPCFRMYRRSGRYAFAVFCVSGRASLLPVGSIYGCQHINGNNRLILLLISLILSSYTQHFSSGTKNGGEWLLPRRNRIKNLTTNLNCKKSNNAFA